MFPLYHIYWLESSSLDFCKYSALKMMFPTRRESKGKEKEARKPTRTKKNEEKKGNKRRGSERQEEEARRRGGHSKEERHCETHQKADTPFDTEGHTYKPLRKRHRRTEKPWQFLFVCTETDHLISSSIWVQLIFLDFMGELWRSLDTARMCVTVSSWTVCIVTLRQDLWVPISMLSFSGSQCREGKPSTHFSKAFQQGKPQSRLIPLPHTTHTQHTTQAVLRREKVCCSNEVTPPKP